MLDRRSKLVIVDIADPVFDPAAYGLTRAEVAGAFCGVLPDGRITRGSETVRAAFREIGLGYLAAWTGWRWTRPAVNAFYRFYARNRVRWGRWLGRQCEGGSCAMDGTPAGTPTRR